MKRTPLQRKTPLKRGTKGLKSSNGLKPGGPLKRSPLKSRSDERAKFMREVRAPLVAAMVETGVTCQIAPILREAGIPALCERSISGLHERRKRSSGGSLVNSKNLIPACSWCNSFIEIEPKLVRELTGDRLVVRSSDPEWEELSSAGDP